mgnify:CR=1 FL=1
MLALIATRRLIAYLHNAIQALEKKGGDNANHCIVYAHYHDARRHHSLQIRRRQGLVTRSIRMNFVHLTLCAMPQNTSYLLYKISYQFQVNSPSLDFVHLLCVMPQNTSYLLYKISYQFQVNSPSLRCRG